MAEPQAIDMSYLILHSVLLIAFTVTATLAVALRLWARRIQKLPLQTSDYLMILGLVRVLDPASSPSAENSNQIFALAQSFLNLYCTLLHLTHGAVAPQKRRLTQIYQPVVHHG